MEGLKLLDDNSINCCITSPPYWGLRDYGVSEQLGLEKTPEEYVVKLVEVFREVKRVLRDDGTLWLNLGDSYASVHTGGHKSEKATVGNNKEGIQEFKQTKANPKIYGLKEKDLVGIPWMVAFALRADGWYLRQDIIWHKPNPMPESVRDRCTKSHEYMFLMSKSSKYYYDNEAIKEQAKRPGEKQTFGGEKARKNTIEKGDPRYRNGSEQWGMTIETKEYRNKRSVWTVTTKPCKEAHFATYPPDLINPCVLAGCPKNGIVLDPFMGAGTTGLVCKQNNRYYIGFELNPEYCEIAEKRIEAHKAQQTLFELTEAANENRFCEGL